MVVKQNPVIKKLAAVTALLIAVTGLIAGVTAFVKTLNPEERKATMAYDLLKQKVIFLENAVVETRKDIRELRLLILASHDVDIDVAKKILLEESSVALTSDSDLDGIGIGLGGGGGLGSGSLNIVSSECAEESAPEETPVDALPEPVQKIMNAAIKKEDKLMAKSKPLPDKL